MHKKTTYAKISAKIILITLIATLISALFYGEYIKRDAISQLAYVDAKKTSKLVFESLYSAMRKGWNKEDIYEIIGRLNEVDPKMRIDVYRGKIVAELFGEITKDEKARQSDPRVKKAMQGTEQLTIANDKMIIYNFPVKATQECLKCHVNAKEGSVLGDIEISYPIDNLKVSLTDMLNSFVLFIMIFAVFVFIIIFLKFDKYLIRPIKEFADTLKKVTASNDVTTRVKSFDNIDEIDTIKESFNQMLDSIEYQFYHDTLTGLGNRRRLLEKLQEKKSAYLMIINLDSFQEINDLYGEEIGDRVLKEFGTFLEEILPKSATICRLFSDEFAYLEQSSKELHELKEIAAALSEKISKKSFNLDSNGEISLSATIGVALGTKSLLASADIALTLAKKRRKNFLLFDDSMAMDEEYAKNLAWTRKIKKAIEEDRIVPLFQPIMDIKSGKVVKYESLMRMMDENGEYIAPLHFLELAKKNKLYHKLTRIMVQKTLETFEELPYQVSINISVEDILFKELCDFIIEKLKNAPNSSNIVFEIIESEGIENFERVIEFIDDVKSYGAKISIDDFGTGYSNFEYLMKLRVDYIKIDGSMIKEIDKDQNARLVTRTIVDFAKRMHIKTIAEFVASREVFEAVSELDVDYAQGYYIGKPAELRTI